MPALEVLDRWRVPLTRGYTDLPFTGQVTAIRFGTTLAYVRENCRASSVDHFLANSCERIRRKTDGPRHGVEVLELAAPAHCWEELAAVVHETDGLRRPVIRRHGWSVRTALESRPRKHAPGEPTGTR